MHRKLASVLTTALLAVPVGAVVAGALTPAAPTAYSAGSAGSVTVGPDASGLKVVSVAPNAGWKPRVDTAKGSSVDVYFRHGTSKVKFEASIEGPKRLRVLVRTCG